MQKQAIIVFGPPGAGKGTQSELLSDKLGLYNFETSGIIQKKISGAQKGDFIEVDGEKYFFEKEKEIASAGKLWDPPFVIYFVNKKIEELAAEDRSIVFSSSPRTLYEIEHMVPLLEKLYKKDNIKIILLEVSTETTIFRNSNRKRCELLRHPILFNDETKNLTICPLDGSKLFQRDDDNAETAKVRIKEYVERTLPMKEYLEKTKYKIHTISGEQSVADVFKDILAAIE